MTSQPESTTPPETSADSQTVAAEITAEQCDTSQSPTGYQLVLCNCPDEATAINIAENIVAQRLAACVNILPEAYSIYHWQGHVESAREHMMLIKTRQSHYASLEKVIVALHPYEIPEIISVDIHSGLPHYLKWIESSIT